MYRIQLPSGRTSIISSEGMSKMMTIFHITIKAEIIIVTLSALETHSTEILPLASIAHNPRLIYSYMVKVFRFRSEC